MSIDDLTRMTVAERQAEGQRQAEVMADAIFAAINECGKQFSPPMMNAVAAALVMVEAGVLATLEPRARKALRQAMERARPGALAAALTGSEQFKTVTVTVRSHDA
jgi:uncharacterized protein YjeT (DUF2065 family)